MPLIELKLRAGRLDEGEVDQLSTELTRPALAAEGSDLDRAGSLTWTLVETYADDEWRVGGGPANGPTYLVRATLVGGLVSDADKERFIARANDAIESVDPDFDPSAAWVLIDELADGNLGAAGTVMSSERIAAVMEIETSSSGST